MTTGLMKEQNVEKQIKKQMGCMSGFLQIFDRQQILTHKRLPPPPPPPVFVVAAASESKKSASNSPPISPEFGNPVDELPPKSPLRLSISESKQGTTKHTWKFSKESPRLSLDSRATTDARGGLHPEEIRTSSPILSSNTRNDDVSSDAGEQRRSSGVIARLMGLEPLPNSTTPESEKKPELRRSASESRVSRDLFQPRFMADGNNVYSKQPPIQSFFDNATLDGDLSLKNVGIGSNYNSSSSPWKALNHRKSYFDSGDIFPEPKQSVATVHGEIEKKLKMRGIDEASKDLETLKQILEALQLKGLLHSRKTFEQSHRTFVRGNDSPIVVMKHSRLSTPPPINRRTGNSYSPSSVGTRRSHSYGFAEETPQGRNIGSPNRMGRNPSLMNRNEGETGHRRSNSLFKPKPLSVETQRRVNETTEDRRVTPKPNPRRKGPDLAVNNRSPRSKKPTAEIPRKEKITSVVAVEDESTSVSGSSVTTSTDTERSKTEEYRDGRNLLQRCDKLLNSIAEMNAIDMQPSPVSVLDYKDESLTPSPVMTKRNIDFKETYNSGESEDGLWSSVISPIRSKCEKISDGCDYVYISDVLRASRYLQEGCDVFLLLEKQQYLNGNDVSKVSSLQRKLIFDTINEILDRNRRLPPWKAVSWTNDDVTIPSFDKVWSEIQRIRERDTADDLFETICGVLKKDLAGYGITGWGDRPVETSDVILDMERLIFKDLISEIIRDLAALASRTTFSSMMPRRKLVF